MPSFFLHQPHLDKDTYILISVQCSDGRVKRSIQKKANKTTWNFETQIPTEEKALTAVLEIKKAINSLIAKCELAEEPLTREMVNAALDKLLKKKNTRSKKKFNEGSHLIIQEMREGKLLDKRTKKKYEPGTIKNYNQSLNTIIEFSTTKNVSVEYSAVSMITYYKFIEFCNEKDWSMNYTGQHLKNWKMLLERGFDKGWHRNKIYEFDDFKSLQEETPDIALEPHEVDAIYKHNLSFNKIKDIARDWFIIGCYTALRVSDLSRLDVNMIDGGMIQIKNEKTDDRAVIPIHSVVQAILKKWGGFPPKMPSQTINTEIKEVAELAKIKGTVLYTVTQGGKTKAFYIPKKDMISLHTARRTFITNARGVWGMPDAIIMKLAGIKKETTLRRYDKMTPEQAAKQAAKHPFFSSHLKAV